MEQLNLTFHKHPALLSPDEIYEQIDQNLLSQLAEDRRLERKPSGIHGKDLGDYFSIWANTTPDGGLIVVGMENKGQFSGCHNLSEKQLNALEKSFHQYCPDAKVTCTRVEVATTNCRSSFVVVFRVAYREASISVPSTVKCSSDIYGRARSSTR